MKMKLLSLVALSIASSMALASEASVKMSTSGMCHDTNSGHYARIKNFTPYSSMSQCLANKGKAYSSYKEGATSVSSSSPTGALTTSGIPKYSRGLYRHWIDTDKDCQDTRQEALVAQSVSTMTYTDKECRVLKGTWNDPYSGERFYDPSKLDIDHVVTLKWAHEHGAYKFSAAKKSEFANDPTNLIAVKASLNRQKGAKPPMEWMPPNAAYKCQYLLRFERIVKKYGLQMNNSEINAFNGLKVKSCKK
ncbi:HNH endonuclease family protein [Vibrio splendidus]|nr:HNH endonuclease family protein [Vibrio splendidus]MCC4880527.1 HNH endonuclease family protein [Vibrio splendidus]